LFNCTTSSWKIQTFFLINCAGEVFTGVVLKSGTVIFRDSEKGTSLNRGVEKYGTRWIVKHLKKKKIGIYREWSSLA
jgi:hypothetical protein